MTLVRLEKSATFATALLRALKHTFGLPRGLLATMTVTLFLLFPYEALRILFFRNKVDTLWRVVIRAIRFSLSDGNVLKNRFIFGCLDRLYYFVSYMKGYTLTQNESVVSKNNAPPSGVKGLWVLDKNKNVPPFQSPEWKKKIVIFWIHGGGFCSGTPATFLPFHTQVIQAFNVSPLNKKRKELIYFCVDYPVAPEADIRKMRFICLKALTWLRTTVGAKDVIVGGDSAGGNLALHLLSDAPQSSIDGTLLISPWLDLSLSYPDGQSLDGLSDDCLTLEILKNWSDVAIFGTVIDSNEGENVKRSHHISPFYGPTSILPHPMIVYSKDEVFGPSIENFASRLEKKQMVRIVSAEGLPHDYPLIGSYPQSGSMHRECKTVVESVVQHLLEEFNVRSTP